MGIARPDNEKASPDVRGCEAGVGEDHQVKVFAHRVSANMDRFAAARLYNAHTAAMGLKDPHKTGAKYPFLRYDQNMVNCCTSYKKPAPSFRHRLL